MKLMLRSIHRDITIKPQTVDRSRERLENKARIAVFISLRGIPFLSLSTCHSGYISSLYDIISDDQLYFIYGMQMKKQELNCCHVKANVLQTTYSHRIPQLLCLVKKRSPSRGSALASGS